MNRSVPETDGESAHHAKIDRRLRLFLIAARASRPCRAKGDIFILPPRGRLASADLIVGCWARGQETLVPSLSRAAVELEPAQVAGKGPAVGITSQVDRLDAGGKRGAERKTKVMSLAQRPPHDLPRGTLPVRGDTIRSHGTQAYK
jgi:hypothetical protein